MTEETEKDKFESKGVQQAAFKALLFMGLKESLLQDKLKNFEQLQDSYFKLEEELMSRGNKVFQTCNELEKETSNIKDSNLNVLTILRRFKACEERQKAEIIIKPNTKPD